MSMKRSMITAAAVAALSFGLSMPMVAGAQEPDPAPIYGSELMTQEERLEYRQRMQSAQDAEEQERIRTEHHEQMQQRAREQGVELPEEPPARGGQGMGPEGGPGMNQGQGMGPNNDNPMRNEGYREDQRQRMHDAESAEERQRIQQERQEQMQEQIRDQDPSYDRRRDDGGAGGGGGMRN
ncbi:hypothetical protein [Guyparkeria sp.]|uniref:hypothetical protein n=1 Tax=Guyparkeria sp. TaxID=2035736 RepID=UPI0039708946